MKALEGIKGALHRVKAILELSPAARDDDKLLWLAYVNQYFGLKRKLGDTAYNSFKEFLLNNDLPSFESISRARRKNQEEHPSLRGFSYEERQTEEKKIKDYFNWTT